MTEEPDFEQLRHMIEAVHHACAAGDLDAAAAILYNRIYCGPIAYYVHILGAYETMLNTFADFFPFQDFTLDPRLSDPSARRWVLHETAACLHVLGQLSLSGEVASRAAAAAMSAGDLHNAAITYHNLAETHLAAGALASCREVTLEAQRIARDAGEMEDQLVAWTLLGRLNDLIEDYEKATENFSSALQIAVEETSVPLLYSLSGVRYAEHLASTSRADEALFVIRENLQFCQDQGWQSDAALCLAQMALIEPASPTDAFIRADDAVRIARTIGAKQTLSETLLSRAELAIKDRRLDVARADLFEVLSNSQQAGYRLLEVDARILLGTTRHGQQEFVAARTEVQLAERLSQELEYTRGASRARAVLSELMG